MIKFTSDEMRYITFFESLTGARVCDCVIDEDGSMVTFVVKKGDIGFAIGEAGKKVRKARHMMGKSIGIVEYSDDPVEFVKNIFKPAKVEKVDIAEQDDKKSAIVTVGVQDRGMAVGRKGRKINNAKKLVKRHHDIQDISLA